MKQYNAELNTVAVDVALEALYGVKGRDEAKRVYELVNTVMKTSFALGAEDEKKGHLDQIINMRGEFEAALKQQSAEAVAVIKSAEEIGFKKGHAAALFGQAVEKLNADAAVVSPALAPQKMIPADHELAAAARSSEETALINAASALG